MKESLIKINPKRRLKPYHVALCVLIVGWVPSLLLAYYHYTVLSRTLESKSIDDAKSLVGSLAQHVKNELERTGETVDYYRTLPVTASLLAPNPAALATTAATTPTPSPTPADWAANARRRTVPPPRPGASAAAPTTTVPAVTTSVPGTLPLRPPPPPGPPPRSSTTDNSALPPAPPPLLTAQEWLSSAYYPQSTRIDGMFLLNAEGRLIAALPPVSSTDTAARPESVIQTLQNVPDSADVPFRLSPAYLRTVANKPRVVVSLVATVRDKAGAVRGYLGADVLVERLAKRLMNIEMPGASVQIVDQNSHPLFDGPDDANTPGQSGIDPDLRRVIAARHKGVKEIRDRLYFFAPVGALGWTAITERPAEAFHQPVRDLFRETALLVGALALATTVAAAVLAGFYRRQLLSSLRVEQAQIFNEKILANMPVGIALIDPAGDRFLHANQTFVEIAVSLGGLGRHEEIANVPFAQAGIASREALARVLGFGVPFQAIEQRTPTANGQTRYLTTNLLRLQDSAQHTLGVLCLVEDNTPAVTLREELINANASKDDFLAQLSHELRNPLSPVLTMVAELDVVTDGMPATRQPLEIIRRNVELEARLIDDLLDVTRISRGKLQISRQLVDVHRTLRLALEICQREVDEKTLTLELDLRAAEHHMQADPARLQQIFWNLIKNAVKFTPENRRIVVRSFNLPGGMLGARVGEARIASATPDGKDEGTALRVEVADEGIGIESQHLRRIFNAFDQGQSSITQRFGGLGLGLAISKAMVEAHGGSLTVASEGINKGATFTVDLETCPAPAEEDAAPLPVVGPRVPAGVLANQGAGRHILLVDDHIDTCLGMSRLLKRRGFRVAVAHSVTDALAKADGETFDLLISDIGLPDGTGFDLMDQLRQRGGPPGIALSGYGMESDIGKSREAGFSEHLTKPVAIDRLDEAMRRLLTSEEG